MERRKILLGSGTVIATVLAGCSNIDEQRAGASESAESDKKDRDGKRGSRENGNGKDEKAPDNDDEKKGRDDENEKGEDVPGFDREKFEIDSDVIQLKKLAYHNHRLDIRVMVTTTDRNVLADELRALAPGFERALRDADAEEFFSEVKQIKFTLYDEHKNTVIAVFIDIRWLQEFLDEDMTEEEFATRLLDRMEEA